MKILDELKNLRLNVLAELKDRLDFYRHAAYLKKMGWTEEAYQKQTDVDYNNRATKVKDYYHGYPYIHVFTTSRGDPWTRYDSWIEALKAIESWCKETCKDKWRTDILRIAEINGEFELNDLGGGDALFFVFKNPEDSFLFRLKWGG